MNQGVQVCGEAPASVLLATYPEAELLDWNVYANCLDF